MLLRKIISGGQTGVDQGALRAAKAVGLETGGWAPRGWRTLDGPAPWLATQFGLREHGGTYAARTRANVRDSDATIRIARDWESPGELCTMKAIRKYGRPHLDLLRSYSLKDGLEPAVEALREFLWKYSVQVLNVAGNSERTAPGIGRTAEAVLLTALRGCLS